MKETFDLVPNYFGDFDYLTDFTKGLDSIFSFYEPCLRYAFNHYSLEDKGDRYEVSVDYDDDTDSISVNKDTDARRVIIKVSEDHDKTKGFSSCVYHNTFIMSVPDDCDIDDMTKTFNKDENKMVISFGKNKDCVKEESKSDCKSNKCDRKKQVTEDDKKEGETKINYKSLYNDLLEKYEREITKKKKEYYLKEKEYNKLFDDYKKAIIDRNFYKSKLEKVISVIK